MDLSLFYLPTWRPGYDLPFPQYYDELVAEVALADRLGWRRVLTTEHHFHYYGGAVPNPAIMLTAWARATTSIRVGAGVSLMQLRHPLKVAEDYAMVDQLSGGRCDMGIGRGFVPHEFRTFGVEQAETSGRIAEGLEICKKFWAGEPFEFHGQYWSFEAIEPWPRTVNGALPIWNAASNSRDSFVHAGEVGYPLMMNQYPMTYPSLVEKFGWYRDAWAAAGRAEADRKALIVFFAHLADTEEQALDEAKGALQEHATAFANLAAGSTWNRNHGGDLSVLLNMCEGDDWRDVFRRRTLICTPEQAAERLAKYAELGFTEVAVCPRYAGLTHAQATATIERFTNEVRPMLTGAPATGAKTRATA